MNANVEMDKEGRLMIEMPDAEWLQKASILNKIMTRLRETDVIRSAGRRHRNLVKTGHNRTVLVSPTVLNKGASNHRKWHTIGEIGACRDLYLLFGDYRFTSECWVMENDLVVMHYIPHMIGRSREGKYSTSVRDVLHRIASVVGKQGDLTSHIRENDPESHLLKKGLRKFGYDKGSTGSYFLKVQMATSFLKPNRAVTLRDCALHRQMYRENKTENAMLKGRPPFPVFEEQKRILAIGTVGLRKIYDEFPEPRKPLTLEEVICGV